MISKVNVGNMKQLSYGGKHLANGPTFAEADVYFTKNWAPKGPNVINALHESLKSVTLW